VDVTSAVAYDVIIVGGGPAGLSAAMFLGRARRGVLVCDAGEGRNAASHGVHGFLTRDGIAPAELRRLGRAELQRYGVEVRDVEVVDAVRRDDAGFDVVLAGGERRQTRALLLATGVVDDLPNVPGLRERYGGSVFHCPYCDGWEMRDRRLAAYARGGAIMKLALALLSWTREVTVVSDGPSRLARDDRATLGRHGIAIREERIAALEGEGGSLERVVFRTGEPLACDALFFKTGFRQRSTLGVKLGGRVDRRGALQTNKLQGTGVPGLYVMGDSADDLQLAIVAAAEGAKAGYGIDAALRAQDLERVQTAATPRRVA
jgi:thioredoxin reductase